MEKLKPCPWCGRVPEIVPTDEEGAPYKPWPRPAGYMIFHVSLGKNDRCPISMGTGMALGTWLYETEEEAAEAWNGRTE